MPKAPLGNRRHLIPKNISNNGASTNAGTQNHEHRKEAPGKILPLAFGEKAVK
jgi:hypothetical protein